MGRGRRGVGGRRSFLSIEGVCLWTLERLPLGSQGGLSWIGRLGRFACGMIVSRVRCLAVLLVVAKHLGYFGLIVAVVHSRRRRAEW